MDRVYRAGEKVAGEVIVHGRVGSSLAHEGISLVAEGSASLQLSAKSVGLFEAFYSTIKPVQLFAHSPGCDGGFGHRMKSKCHMPRVHVTTSKMNFNM